MALPLYLIIFTKVIKQKLMQKVNVLGDLRAELVWYGTVWDDVHQQAAALDELIHSFNEATGVLGRL